MDRAVQANGEGTNPQPWEYFVLRLGPDGNVIQVPIGPVPPAPPNTRVSSPQPPTPPPSPPRTNGHT
ncbi:hypothetical protein GMOD_00000223 [Pyrenophora seminiperda CCB06]|uniref:Uncharacterized protein n=1 Tax=Pyrenophora seminiperda CCB06 TaxID=1302712 RepID=A0A3M7M6P9_9PLEO|nr:hypothetical protein GMOD_00000223 [Pyrenophora seminiperda CCB06]